MCLISSPHNCRKFARVSTRGSVSGCVLGLVKIGKVLRHGSNNATFSPLTFGLITVNRIWQTIYRIKK